MRAVWAMVGCVHPSTVSEMVVNLQDMGAAWAMVGCGHPSTVSWRDGAASLMLGRVR